MKHYHDKRRELAIYNGWKLCVLFMKRDAVTNEIDIDDDYAISKEYIELLVKLEKIIDEFGLPQIGSKITIDEEHREIIGIDYDYNEKTLFIELY
jgi:hypothetical protein